MPITTWFERENTTLWPPCRKEVYLLSNGSCLICFRLLYPFSWIIFWLSDLWEIPILLALGATLLRRFDLLVFFIIFLCSSGCSVAWEALVFCVFQICISPFVLSCRVIHLSLLVIHPVMMTSWALFFRVCGANILVLLILSNNHSVLRIPFFIQKLASSAVLVFALSDQWFLSFLIMGSRSTPLRRFILKSSTS
jgi:hypothetical protein